MRNKKKGTHLWLYFTLVIFLTILVVFLIMLILWRVLYHYGVIVFYPIGSPIFPLLLLLASIIIGSSVAVFVGRLIIRPIQHIENAFGRLAEGDFSVRVSTEGSLREITEMAESFNEMAHDLSQIETLRSDFVTNVSHEFKTPIAAIEGYATLLQNEQFPPEKRQLYVDKIISNSRRLSDLTSNILTLSKLENQETIPDRERYRLDEQIRKNILLLEDKWTEKNIDLDLTLPDVEFWGNESLLDEVWFNLFDNALKHSPEGGTVEVILTAFETSVRVSVGDHGDGMDEEVKKHIFEKFYQGDSSHTGEGSGLGLALAKRIIDLCGGEIAVDSSPGTGAVFIVTLPL